MEKDRIKLNIDKHTNRKKRTEKRRECVGIRREDEMKKRPTNIR